MKILDRILYGSSEYDIFGRSKKIIDQAVAANKILVEIINGSKDLETIHEIEHIADSEVFDIANSVTSGGIAPNLIDDAIQFVNKEDDIVDIIFNLSRAIVRYRRTKKDIDGYTKIKLLAITDLINSALILLYEMHKAKTLKEARRIRARIKAIEHNGDIMKDALLDYAYEHRMDFRSFYYVQSVAYFSDDILDACEDTSDMIVSIMSSVIT